MCAIGDYYPLILASASPRRRELLQREGYVFSVAPCPFPEPQLPEDNRLSAEMWAEALAYFKARSVSQTHRHAIVIGADTVVSHRHHIIGKPADRQDAERILSTLFGGENDVITALAVLCPAEDRRVITHEVTTLLMRPMNKRQVKDYLDSGVWQDKAGAYALQEGGDRFVQEMRGSESNVVGMPMEKLAQVLKLFSTNEEGKK